MRVSKKDNVCSKNAFPIYIYIFYSSNAMTYTYKNGKQISIYGKSGIVLN